MTSFLQVSDNSDTRALVDSLNNTTSPITLSGIDTTKFIEVTTGYAVTIWDDETFPNPDDDPNMEKALVTAATIDSSGSFTLTRPFAKTHSGTPRIALLVLAQHIKDHSTAINALETKTSNIDNTSDLNKPISTATQMALNGKEPTITAGTTSQYYRGDKTWQPTLDLPVSTATQTALDLKQNSLGFIPENIANKSTTTTLGASNTLYPTQNAVKTYVDTQNALYVLKAGDTMTGALTTRGLAVVASVGVISATSQSANTFSSGLEIRKRGTTGDATAAVTGGSELGYHSFYGWSGSANKRLVYVIARASGDTTPTTGGGTYAIVTRDSAGTEAQRLFLNETGMSLGTTAPTHTITLPSTATGIALYNTVDQTTNYERVRQYWSGSQFNIVNEVSGTGAARAIRLGVYAGGLYISNASSLTQGFIRADQGSVSGNQSIFSVNGSLTASSNIQVAEVVTPTINQSGTAGYTAILANVTETATGSGAKNLMDLQVNGVSRFKVSNTGATSIIDGTQGAGKVLTSDASGNASWQAPSGGGSGITRSIVTTSGNVTAGATASTDYVYIITGAHTVTLPTAVGNTNKYDLNNASGSPVSLAFTSGQTANGGGVTLGVNESITLISDNANWRIL